jgi:hypothetical protein
VLLCVVVTIHVVQFTKDVDNHVICLNVRAVLCMALVAYANQVLYFVLVVIISAPMRARYHMMYLFDWSDFILLYHVQKTASVSLDDELACIRIIKRHLRTTPTTPSSVIAIIPPQLLQYMMPRKLRITAPHQGHLILAYTQRYE